MDKFIDGLMIVVAVSIAIFALLLPKLAFRSPTPNFFSTVNINPGQSDQSGNGSIGPAQSNIYLSQGNAASAYDPNSEYIVLTNGGPKDIDITGWQLTNGKASRVYPGGAGGIRYSSDTAIIPQGVKTFNPLVANYPKDIILKPGERAILITGTSAQPDSYPLPSFEENSCTGYLNQDYRFPEGIGQSCSYPSSEPGISGQDRACRDYIDSLSSCHEPTLTFRNDEALSSACRNFIQTHYNYSGCVANHSSDTQFSGNTWHVYLHREWEMWADKYETITLSDRAGNLIAELSY